MIKQTDRNLPAHISLDYYDDYMHIQQVWFSIATLLQSVFLLIWVGGIAYGLSFMIDDLSDQGGMISILIPLIFVVGFLAAAYSIAAKWVNKTDIFVAKELMEIKIGPIFWFGNMRLDTKDIKRFYVQEKLSNSRNGRRRRTVTYDVRYMKQSGTSYALLKDLSSFDAAQFIVQKIADYLGMETTVEMQ